MRREDGEEGEREEGNRGKEETREERGKLEGDGRVEESGRRREEAGGQERRRYGTPSLVGSYLRRYTSDSCCVRPQLRLKLGKFVSEGRIFLLLLLRKNLFYRQLSSL